jgi:hypothetical protein
MREGYVNFTVADHDLFDERFDDLAFVLDRQGRPPFMERIGLVQHVIGGQLADLQEVHFGLQLGQFDQKLVQPLLGWFVEITKALGGDVLLDVKPVCPGHFIPDFLDFSLVGVQQCGFLGQVPVGFFQVAGDAFRLAEKDF